jgi:hypothetical protein
MSENPSRRVNKVFIVLIMEYPEEGEGGYDSVSIVYVTQDKVKIQDIERLWDIIEKNRHNSNWKHPEKDKSNMALNELKKKYGIITWSGVELRVEEEDLQ